MLPTPVPPTLTFEPVRRVRLDDLTPEDVAHLFGGRTPLVVEGLDAHWPQELSSDRIRDIVAFRKAKPNSVFVDGKQVFNLDYDDFIDAVEANRNVRVFGVTMTREFEAKLWSPPVLFDELRRRNLFRYDKAQPVFFIGGGGAVTPLHHDFEYNLNWHIVIAGERPVYLWPYEESGRLFKFPVVGLSLIPFARGLVDHRFARGYKTVLKKGDLLFMPSKCWHQIEYPTPSMAATFAFHQSEEAKAVGTAAGHFWFGMMSFGQAIGRGRALALATLPLMLPFSAFSLLFVPANFAASALPGRARRVASALLAKAEGLVYCAYRPLMAWYRRKLWVGY